MRVQRLKHFGNGTLNRRILVCTCLVCFVLPCIAQQNLISPAATQDKSFATASPVVNPYVVGVGDVLDINVWKEPELSRSSVAVRPDGMISLPLIGEVKINGKTPSQIHDVLVAQLSRYLSAAQVTVAVAEIKSKAVYVTGEVSKPGEYPLLAPSDILRTIIRAGGLTSFARSKSIAVIRVVDGKQYKIAVNYKKLLRGESPETPPPPPHRPPLTSTPLR
jgi:polysaccharide biosynthesis/export protein